MAHPKNKAERIRIGKQKAKKRMSILFPFFPEEKAVKTQHLLEDTTKLCSNPCCCGNPRKAGEKTRKEIQQDGECLEEYIETQE